LFKVNWAVAVASSLVEKKCRDLILLEKVNASKTMSTNLTEGTCTRPDFSTRSVKDFHSKGLGLARGLKQVQASFLYPTHSPFVLCNVESQKVQLAATVSSERYRDGKSQILQL
jgi:hypothetical protein